MKSLFLCMEFKVYIIYSKSIDKFYTGFTSQSVQQRLAYHLAKHRGFTANAYDWEIAFVKVIESKKAALALERKIKKRGAKRFLNDLIS